MVKGAGRCEEKVDNGPSRSQPSAWNATRAILEWAAHGALPVMPSPRLFTDHVLPCCKALLPLPPSSLLTDRDTRLSPNGSHTSSTLSATLPADPLGLLKPRP
jgi:hypothetical protein